jgi:hypothetical protein
MMIGAIENQTRVLGHPTDWDKNKHGVCCSLPIRDEPTTVGNLMWSAWFPTPEEIKAMTAGAPIHLGVVGDMHPVVCLTVGSIPG